MQVRCDGCGRIFDSHDGGYYYADRQAALCPGCNGDEAAPAGHGRATWRQAARLANLAAAIRRRQFSAA
jgi:hypothetical protein